MMSMDDVSEIMQGVEYKTLQLIKRLEQLEKENFEIKGQLKTLHETEEENSIKIKYLEEKNKIIKIANTLEGQDKTKAKLKINELLREVERCLALLNK